MKGGDRRGVDAFRGAALVAVLLGSASSAQNGDVAGEVQAGLPDELVVPPAPVLSPEDALAAFTLERGLAIELVASEPLVEDPVAVAFDGDGRLWVCEMKGYMPNADGTGEREPNGSIVVLNDDDGDGRMDRRTVFLDGLVLPRAVTPVRDGALVLAPPELAFWRDTDGDGRADEKTVLETGLGGILSPEHATNGFVFTLDNHLRPANHHSRYRLSAEGLELVRGGVEGGQWGITRDDAGRVFYNTNPDPLRGELYPSHYAFRNPAFGRAAGINVRFAHDMRTWPVRVTPGVNRGYRPETLRDDYTLRVFTAACGPLIYRGDALPAAYRGDAFVCEPSGNLVKRYRLQSDGLRLTAVPAVEGREFLASTDERFRPVNLVDGPDGALYVVDLYRGILQHRLFLTTFLRRQIEARGLAEPLGLGRIWRIVPRDFERPAPLRTTGASWTELAALFEHQNGFWRDTAQRLFVEEGRGSRDAVEVLRERVAAARHPWAAVQASWALQGLGELRRDDVVGALASSNPDLVRNAVRLAEPWLRAADAELLERVHALAARDEPRLRHQVLLSLGSAECTEGDRLLVELAGGALDERLLRDALLSGLAGREAAFLTALLEEAAWRAAEPGRPELLSALARTIASKGVMHELDLLLEHIVALPADWRRVALVAGLAAAREQGPTGELLHVRLARRPEALVATARAEAQARSAASEPKRASDLGALLELLAWPGKPGVELPVVRPLTELERARRARGREHYLSACLACHQESGRGLGGLAPPLRGSRWVLGSEERLVRIVMQGLHGPLDVRGTRWNQDMPAWIADDEDLAAVLTYIRREWGHGAEPITPQTVARIRAAEAQRARPWTAAELLEVP